MAVTWPAISSVAFAVWLASPLTSEATTAKPLPASPARAASMVALARADWSGWRSRSIRRSTSPIFSPAAARPATISVVLPALATAVSATSLEWVTWRPISATEEASSSVAAATVLMLAEASSEAAAAAAACAEVPLTLAVISRRDALHVLRRPRDRADHALDVGFETVGHWPLQRLLLELGLRLGGFLRLAQQPRLDHVAAEHVDSTAMVPSSSLRSPPGIVTSVSPLERRFMTAVIAVKGATCRGRAGRPARRPPPELRSCRQSGCAAISPPPPRIRWCP